MSDFNDCSAETGLDDAFFVAVEVCSLELGGTLVIEVALTTDAVDVESVEVLDLEVLDGTCCTLDETVALGSELELEDFAGKLLEMAVDVAKVLEVVEALITMESVISVDEIADIVDNSM